MFAGCLADSQRGVLGTLTKLERMHSAHCLAQQLNGKSWWVAKSLRRTWLSWPVVADSMEQLSRESFLEFPPEVLAKTQAAFAVGNTKVVEDFFNKARQIEQKVQANTVVSNRRIWATAIQRRVLAEVHGHNEVDKDSAFAAARATGSRVPPTLDPELFHSRAQAPVVDLPALAGKKKEPDWPTLSPLGQAVLYAEVQVWMQAADDPTVWDHLTDLWLSACLEVGMCVKKRATQEWFFSLGHIEHTAVLGWRARVVESGGSRFMVPVVASSASDIASSYAWLVVVDLGDWVCQPLRWVAPSFKFNLGSAGLSAGVGSASSSSASPARQGLAEFRSECCGAAVCVGSEVPLVTALANIAFGNLNESLVTRLLKLAGVELKKGADFFEKLMAGMKKWSTLDDAGLALALYSRVQPSVHTTSHDDAFCSTDVAKGCFDASDMPQVDNFLESSKKCESKAPGFQAKVVDLVRKTRPRYREARNKPPSGGPRPDMSQAEAQVFLPVGARNSKDVPNSRWLVVWKPFGTISRSWPCWGDVNSLAQVLKWAWDHAEKMGRKCPHEWIRQLCFLYRRSGRRSGQVRLAHFYGGAPRRDRAAQRNIQKPATYSASASHCAFSLRAWPARQRHHAQTGAALGITMELPTFVGHFVRFMLDSCIGFDCPCELQANDSCICLLFWSVQSRWRRLFVSGRNFRVGLARMSVALLSRLIASQLESRPRGPFRMRGGRFLWVPHSASPPMPSVPPSGYGFCEVSSLCGASHRHSAGSRRRRLCGVRRPLLRSS